MFEGGCVEGGEEKKVELENQKPRRLEWNVSVFLNGVTSEMSQSTCK